MHVAQTLIYKLAKSWLRYQLSKTFNQNTRHCVAALTPSTTYNNKLVSLGWMKDNKLSKIPVNKAIFCIVIFKCCSFYRNITWLQLAVLLPRTPCHLCWSICSARVWQWPTAGRVMPEGRGPSGNWSWSMLSSVSAYFTHASVSRYYVIYFANLCL